MVRELLSRRTQRRLRVVTWSAWLVVASAVFAHTLNAQALAQGEDLASADALAADLSRTVQGQVRAALERHLRPEEFQAFAKVTPADSAKPVPYMPETFAPIAGGVEQTAADLAPLVKRIDIEIIISDQYDETAKAKLKSIVAKTIGLNDARGDTVKFTSLGLKVERPDSVIARDLARSEAETREFKSQVETLSREREDAKRDLTAAKSELDRVAREKASTPSADGQKDKDVASSSQTPVEPKGFWQENAPLIVGAIIALLAIFASSAALRGASKSLSEAVQSIGAGIPALGDKLSESLAQKPQAMLPASDSFSRGESINGTSATSINAALPMEAVAKRVLELHTELSNAVDDSNEPLVLEYLSALLEDDLLTSRAVATMELLGKEKANHLYNRLALSHQQKVFTFLRTGVYAKPKGEVMLEAGEELKTKLFGASFSSRAQLGDDVSQKLLLLGIDGQVAVAHSLEGPSLSRFFLYLEPAKTVTVLSRLREKDPKRFERAAALVVKIPEVETAKDLDQEILTAIEGQLARATADVQAPYLTHYRKIVELADDEVAESLAEFFSAANSRVERFMRETIVTFGTFFKLHGDIQEEIVSTMNNKDLAALVSLIKPELKTVIYGHVEDRRKELVDEELDRLTSKGTRSVNAAHRAAKQQIVQRIVQIKGNGPLSELLAKPVDGLPAATPQPNQRAA